MQLEQRQHNQHHQQRQQRWGEHLPQPIHQPGRVQRQPGRHREKHQVKPDRRQRAFPPGDRGNRRGKTHRPRPRNPEKRADRQINRYRKHDGKHRARPGRQRPNILPRQRNSNNRQHRQRHPTDEEPRYRRHKIITRISPQHWWENQIPRTKKHGKQHKRNSKQRSFGHQSSFGGSTIVTSS